MAKKNNQEASAPVEQSLSKQEATLLKYRKQVIAAVVAILVVVGGVVAYKNLYAKDNEEKASTALAYPQALFAQGEYQKALDGEKGKEGFLAIAEGYTFTDAKNLAKLYAGLCYANLGKWPEAVKYLEDFSAQDDAMVSPTATAALGNAYANIGDVDKAVSTLKMAAKMADSESVDGANNSISPTFLIQAARLLESQKKSDEALAIYKEVKEKYVSSADMEIDKYIERLSK